MQRIDFTTWKKDDEKPYDVRLPFRRVKVPRDHLIQRDPPEKPSSFPSEPLDGRGYDCGCRSPEDYDRKIGKDVGDTLGGLSKAIPGYAAVPVVLGTLSGWLRMGGGVPVIGPTLQKLGDTLDEWKDPLRKLVSELGGLIDAMLVDSLMRGVPSWVFPYRKLPRSQWPPEQEVDGYLVRSRLRPDAIPFTQWHHWYDWSFVVDPSPTFQAIVGKGNQDRHAAEDRWWAEKGEEPLVVLHDRQWGKLIAGDVIDKTIECEIDLGAIGEEIPFIPDKPEDQDLEDKDLYDRSPFSNKTVSGTVEWRRDWNWPQTGRFFWATGWPAYDCSHSTEDAKAVGLHLNQLHPIKAWATARWEARLFREASGFRPAMQFSFFACDARASGGDLDWPGIHDCDYEFIVDLPPSPPPSDTPFPIGPTPPYDRTTLVMRPRLLIEADPSGFAGALKPFPLAKELRPIVQLLPLSDPARPQALVRIPLTQAKPDSSQVEKRSFRSYGVTLSMGWLDRDPKRDGKLFKVSFIVHKLEMMKGAIFRDHPIDKHETVPEWHVRIGVNGRWAETQFRPHVVPLSFPFRIPERTDQPLAMGMLELVLRADDPILVSVHGFREKMGTIFRKPERVKIKGDQHDDEGDDPPPNLPGGVLGDLVNAFDRARRRDRRLRLHKEYTIPGRPGTGEQPTQVSIPFIGKVVKWFGDVIPAPTVDPKLGNKTASQIVRAMFLRLASEEAMQANTPLGIVDPQVPDPGHEELHQRPHDGSDTRNPITPREILAQAGPRKFLDCRATAYRADFYGRMASIAYDPKEVDYVFHYRVRVEPLAEPGGDEETPPG